VIGFEPVQAELLAAVPGGSGRPDLPAGTRGRATCLRDVPDLALFIAATGERAVVLLVHLRELDDRTVAGDGGS